MSNAATPTTTRTITISQLLLSLAVVFMLGAVLVPDVDATKIKGKGSVQSRNQAQREVCEIGGGTLEVTRTGRNTWTTKCHGGDSDGYTCVNTKKYTDCSMQLTQTPQSPLNDVGGAPIDGGNEDPTSGGGADPGAGGGVDPGPGADPDPSDGGGGVILTTYDGGKHHEARHHGTRKHHRHGERHR